MTPDTFNKIALAVVAICAMFIGPFLQWTIARRQATDNVSAKRQQWIDGLRANMAELLANLTRLHILSRDKDTSEEGRKKKREEVDEREFRALELMHLVTLRLNPNEDEHNELNGLLTKLLEAASDAVNADDNKPIDDAFEQTRRKVVAQMQAILKHEWERVKHGRI